MTKCFFKDYSFRAVFYTLHYPTCCAFENFSYYEEMQIKVPDFPIYKNRETNSFIWRALKSIFLIFLVNFFFNFPHLWSPSSFPPWCRCTELPHRPSPRRPWRSSPPPWPSWQCHSTISPRQCRRRRCRHYSRFGKSNYWLQRGWRKLRGPKVDKSILASLLLKGWDMAIFETRKK